MTILVNSQMLHDFNNKKIIHNKHQITLFEKKLCAICAYHHLSCEFDSGTLTTFYDQVCQGCLRIVVFFLRSLSSPMLPVSLDCPFLIAPSVFSSVYFMRVLRGFLWQLK